MSKGKNKAKKKIPKNAKKNKSNSNKTVIPKKSSNNRIVKKKATDKKSPSVNKKSQKSSTSKIKIKAKNKSVKPSSTINNKKLKSVKKTVSASSSNKNISISKASSTIKANKLTPSKKSNLQKNKLNTSSASSTAKSGLKFNVPAKNTPTGKVTEPTTTKKTSSKEAAPQSKNISNQATSVKNWKKKFRFEEEIKAGKETIKEIPALIIETKKEEKDTIEDAKIKDITSSVTNPSFSTSFLDSKTDREPPGKFEMEFMVRCSPDLLFEFLYTPSGLSEWFCDDVNIRNGVYTFNWNGEIGQARLLKMVEGEKVRYQWVNRTDGAYFEFRIVKDDLTGDVSLLITDFADPSWDIEGGKRLWQQQIERLLKLIGSLY